MMTRRVLWFLGALAGVVLAAGVTYAASSLSTPQVGLSGEPPSAGADLAPAHHRHAHAEAAPEAHRHPASQAQAEAQRDAAAAADHRPGPDRRADRRRRQPRER